MKITREKVFSLALFYLIAWCISPPLAYGGLYRLLALAAVAGIFAYQLIRNRMKLTKRQFILLVLMAYIVLLTVISGDSFSHRIGILLICGIALCATSMEEEYRSEDLQWLIPAAFLLCLVWNICTLREIQNVPNIMRILAKNTPVGPVYAAKGVGGYGYMYTVMLLMPLGIDYMLKKRNSLVLRVLAAAFVVTTWSLAMESQYFMAILLVLLMIPMYFVFYLKNRTAKILLTFVLILSFVMIYLNAERIILFLLRNIEGNGAVARKLRDIYDVLQGDRVENTEFSTRQVRYSRTIMYALTHPIFGGISYLTTGNHSTILDILAQYGLPIGGIMIFQIFIVPFGRIKTPVQRVIFVTVFTLAVLNVIPFAMASVLYILMPVYENSKKEETL